MRESIDDIRKRIEKIDYEILRMMASRTAAAVEMGQRKAGEGLPLRAPAVEEKVISRYVDRAKEFGMSAESASQIAMLLIRESIEQQGRIPRPSMIKRILIVGGNGKMGMWLARFFASRGHKIKICDLAENPQFPVEHDLVTGASESDVIIIATPISVTDSIIEKLINIQPKALIFDIASIKSPFIGTIKKASENGLRFCSIHPMFGPDANGIIDRNVIVCDCGSRDAVKEVEVLIDGSNITELTIEEHDHIMAYMLGLSHAVSIAFFKTLCHSDIDYSILRSASSTTFKRQAEIAKDVAVENGSLYYEIQHLNPFNQEALAHLESAVKELRLAGLDDNSKAFIDLMNDGKRYFGDD